jgi:hypothetical protein
MRLAAPRMRLLPHDTSEWRMIGSLCSSLCLIPCLAGILLSQLGPAQAVLLKVDPKPVAMGASSSVKIHLSIQGGFKVPKRPAPKIQLNAIPEIEVKGVTTLIEDGTGKDPEYFSAFKPVVLQINPSKNTRPGQYQLEGKFVYFYCSEREKFCSRSIENFRIPIEVYGAK